MSARWTVGLAAPDRVASVADHAAELAALGLDVVPFAAENEDDAPALDALVFVLDARTLADPARLEPALMAITAQINQLHEHWHQRRPGDVRVPVATWVTGEAHAGFAPCGALIGRPVAYLRTRRLEELVEGICGQLSVAPSATAVRPLLQRSAMLLDFLMTLEIDFQVILGAAPVALDVAGAGRDEAGVAPSAGARQLADWLRFTLQRARALRSVSRLRAQFVTVALLALVVLSVPYLLDGSSVRATLPRSVDAVPPGIELALERDAGSTSVRWLEALALPGTAAQRTARGTAEVLAAWRAHEFLRDRVGRAPTPDSLRSWSDRLGRGTPAGEELFEDWRRLPARDREEVQAAVRAALLRHDLAVAAEVERLTSGRSLHSGVDASEPERACERLLTSFVLPLDAAPELRRLHARLVRRCEVFGLDPGARGGVLLADRWRDQVAESFAAGAVTPGRVTEWLARIPAPPSGGATAPALLQRRRELEVAREQLERVRAAFEAQRAGDVPRYTALLADLRSTPVHGIQTIENWARQRSAEAGRAASG